MAENLLEHIHIRADKVSRSHAHLVYPGELRFVVYATAISEIEI